MATTPNHGIYYPSATDQIAPLEGQFSSLASSVENALNGVDTELERIDTLEADALKREPAVTGQNGYTIGTGTRLFTLGPLNFFTLQADKASGLDAVNVAKLPAGTYPASTITVEGVASLGDSASSVTLTVTTTGDVRLWSARPTNTRLTAQIIWATE